MSNCKIFIIDNKHYCPEKLLLVNILINVLQKTVKENVLINTIINKLQIYIIKIVQTLQYAHDIFFASK